MDHRSEPALGQQIVEPRAVGEVAHDELGLLRRPAVAGIEIVVDDGPWPASSRWRTMKLPI